MPCTLGPYLHKCLPVHTQNGKAAYAEVLVIQKKTDALGENPGFECEFDHKSPKAP